MPLLALQAAQPRLNRSEYAYSVRDLLGIDLDAAADLPKDDSGYGFDNIADALSVSPLLMEQYLKAAERAAHVAVFGPDTVRPAVERFQAPRRGPAVLAPGSLDPTGLSLTDSVHKRYVFPAAGEYRITAYLDGKSPQALEVGFWLDGRQMASAKVDGGIEVDRRVEGRMQVARGEHVVSLTFLHFPGGIETRFNYLEIAGPFGGAAKSRGIEAAAIPALARRAFRRPVTAAEVDRLLA